MSSNSWHVPRRKALVLLGSPFLAAAGAADHGVRLVKDGFELLEHGTSLWTVDAVAVLGPGCVVELGAPNHITCRGSSAGQPCTIDLRFTRHDGWTVSGTVVFSADQPILLAPVPVPRDGRGPVLAGRIAARTATQLGERLFPHWRPRLERLTLDGGLRQTLTLGAVASPWPGLAVPTRWTLQPSGAATGRYDRLAAAALGGETDLPLGSASGVAVSVGVAEAVCWLARRDDGWTGVLLHGRLVLRAGTVRLPLDAAAADTVAAFGNGAGGHRQAELVAWLAGKEAPVETPCGTLELSGTPQAGPNVVAKGDGTVLRAFETRCTLTGTSIRLPLDDRSGRQRFAELGRLDFVGCPFALRVGDLNTPPGVEGVLQLAPSDQPPLSLLLNSARLTVRRGRDLLSLVFGFHGLVLEAGRGHPRLRAAAGLDPRNPPTLRVQFPPQHVEEHAFFRQRPTPPAPEPALAAAQLDQARDRSARRRLVRDWHPTGGFAGFTDRYRKEYGKTGVVPPDDPDYDWFGEELAFGVAARQAARKATEPQKRFEDFRLGLDRDTIAAIVRRITGSRPDDPGQPGKVTTPDQAFALIQDLVAAAEARDNEHMVLQEAWRSLRTPGRTGLPARFYAQAWQATWSSNEPVISRLIAGTGMWDQLARHGYPDPTGLQRAVDDVFSEQPTDGPVEARAAGTSLLVFEPKLPEDGLLYSLALLLSWKDMHLRVSARAQRFEPTTPDQVARRLADLGMVGRQDVPARMERIRASLADAGLAPQLHGLWADTRIEVPSGLFLSPAADAAWQPSRAVPGIGPVPLWRAELREAPGRASTLRAIGSPDFVVDAFGAGSHAPLRGPGPSRTNKDGKFRTALDRFDRHQIVGLSSAYGLPVIPRYEEGGKLNASQVAPPPGYELGSVWDGDKDAQAIYVPQALSTRLLTLSALGATFDFDARFTPPSALRDPKGNNLFDAFSIDRVQGRYTLGRAVLVEVLYRGFLLPFGHRATLVKVSERRFEPGPLGASVAVLTQRLYIEVATPDKAYPAVGQPFAGRGFPAAGIKLVTTRTPDLIEPFDPAGDGTDLKEQPTGALTCRDQVGLVFWPRTARTAKGDIAFRLRVDNAHDAVAMPMLFVDNQAAHDAATLRRVQAYYNTLEPDRRGLSHAGARRRYATPRQPGDTSFETTDWLLRLDTMREDANLDLPSPAPGDVRDVAVTSSLEGADQVPLYPRLDRARIHHGPAARFSGTPQSELAVTYYAPYLRTGFSLPGGKAEVTQADARGEHLGADTFLDVLEPVSAMLDFGSNGDNAGGLGRPAHPIRALARVGPVGSADLATGCPPLPATRTKPLASFGASFFDDKAKILGVIPIRELVRLAISRAGTAAPLLRETLDYACEGVAKVGGDLGKLVGEIQAVVARAEVAKAEVGSLGFRDLYPEVATALDDAKVAAGAMTEDACKADPTLLPRAAATFQRLAQALERVAAHPVAPLLDATRARVEAGRELVADARTALATRALAARAEVRSLIEARKALLLPVTVDWLARRLDPPAQAALAGVRNTLDQAIAGVLPTRLDEWVAHPEPLPPTLAALRAELAARARDAVLRVADRQRDFQVQVALSQLAAATEPAINGLPLPGAIADLYAVAVAATVSWQAMVDAATQALAAALGAASETAARLCATQGALSALLPPDLQAHFACAAPAGCPPAGTDWCAAVWKAVCALPPGITVRQPTEALFAALERLAGDVAELSPAASPACDPEALAAAWQRVPADWAHVLDAARDWVAALAALPAAAEAEVRELATTVVGHLVPANTVAVVPPFAGLQAAFARLAQARDALADKAVPLQAALGMAGTALAAFRDAVAGLPGQVGDLVFTHLRDAMAARAEAMASSARPGLAEAYDAIVKARDQAAATLGELDRKLGSGGSGTAFACAVFDGLPGQASCVPGAHDELWNEAQALADAAPPVLPRIAALVAKWRGGAAAPQHIAAQLERHLREAALAKVVQVLDLGGLREKLADQVAALVPSAVENEYRFEVPLNPFTVLGGVEFEPGKDGKLSLTATTRVKLPIPGRPPPAAPEVRVSATLSSFALNLASAITLHFKPFTYVAEPGKKGHLTAELDHVEFGAALAFLAALAAFFAYSDSGGSSKDGKALRNGPYLTPRRRGPGLVAGYRLGIPAFSIGNVGFANIALDAHLELPFDGAAGVSVLGLSSRESPFVISYAPYGGSGFAVIESDGHGPRRMDFQLEFGGAAVVNYTPLKGTGRAMTGFYISHNRPDSSVCANPRPGLSGTHSASFTGSVAGFGVASCFYMTMGYQPGGSMTGSVKLSFSFSVGPVAVEFEVHVERNEGGSMQSGSSAEVTEQVGATVRQVVYGGDPPPVGVARVDVPSPGQDWNMHRTLFDRGLRARGRRAA